MLPYLLAAPEGGPMRKLLCYIPNHECATSYWRAGGPLSKLRHPDWAIDLNGNDAGWPTLIQYDAVFFQRPYTADHVEVMSRCKKMNIPTWIDYDDNLFEVPLSNPAFSTYGRKDIQSNIRKCLEMATVASVSTEPLKTAMRDDAIVIRNAWNFDNLPLETPAAPPNKIIAWRGSKTHDEDVLTHGPAIMKIYNEYPEYNWVFFGGITWQLAKAMKDFASRVKVYNATDVMSYFHILKETRPEWLIVPLKDSNFNRCKSDIAWMESTWAGAACLGPNMPEWSQCALQYNADHLYTQFKSFSFDAVRQVGHNQAQLLGRSLTDANSQRWGILDELANRR